MRVNERLVDSCIHERKSIVEHHFNRTKLKFIVAILSNALCGLLIYVSELLWKLFQEDSIQNDSSIRRMMANVVCNSYLHV